ncbi:hypothetical protein J6590_072402 [Homalodisca vitripennis]|nr:hypothetical protein J6590_072402 [Homalodisca vitripennis]
MTAGLIPANAVRADAIAGGTNLSPASNFHNGCRTWHSKLEPDNTFDPDTLSRGILCAPPPPRAPPRSPAHPASVEIRRQRFPVLANNCPTLDSSSRRQLSDTGLQFSHTTVRHWPPVLANNCPTLIVVPLASTLSPIQST